MQAAETWIDTHVHLDGKYGESVDFEGAMETAWEVMQGYGIEKSIVMPPPQPPGHRNGYECDIFLDAVKKAPHPFAFLCGGGSLNVMIHATPGLTQADPELRHQFEEKAREFIRLGASGFGEMTAEHLSRAQWHPYESAPADHPLFLLLADLAAEADLVIDLHLDLIAEDIPLPDSFSSPPNPEVLKANLPAFERLLEHNRKAKIVWVHFGWDQIGHWTPALMRALLERHSNLYVSIKANPTGLPQNGPLVRGGNIKPDWLELLGSFSDRFVIGSDTFYASSSVEFPMQKAPPQMSLTGLSMLYQNLPADLARKVGYENAVRLYKLR